MNYSPGPWHSILILDEDKILIRSNEHPHTPVAVLAADADANAALISAAPQLLESLKICLDFMNGAVTPIIKIAQPQLADRFLSTIAIMDRVIKKAEGE